MFRFLVLFFLISASLFAQHNNEHLPFYSDKFRQMEELLPTPNVYRNASGAPGYLYWQQQVDYLIDVYLDEDNQTLNAEQVITYKNNSPDQLNFIWFQLDQNRNRPNSIDNMTRTVESSLDQPNDELRLNISELARYYYLQDADLGYNIHTVTLEDGTELEYTIVGTLLRVDLPSPIVSGGELVFNLSYDFKMRDGSILRSRGGFETFENDRGDEPNYSFMAAQWFPRLVAYTDYEGWTNKEFIGRGEFTLEFGNYTVNINVPSDHIVSSTGELANAGEVLTEQQRERLFISENADRPVYIVTPEEARESRNQKSSERAIWSFEAQNVRDFAWASSRTFIWDAKGFHQENEENPLVMAMSFYPEEGMPLWNDYSTEVVVHTLEVYNRFAFDYPYPTAQSVSAGFLGGMEYPMITFNGPRTELQANGTRTYSLADKRFLIAVIIHEIGHFYFPMIVNSDERQWTWMDEGLNSYLDGVASREWDEEIPWTGVEPRDLTGYMRSINQVPIMTNSESILNFGPNAYTKPAVALNILREVILGRDLFDFAFREYSNRWQFKRPTPSDFFRTMEEASGVDLDWFWRGWFYTTDHVDLSIDNVYELRLNSLDPDIDFDFNREVEKSLPQTYFSIRNLEEGIESWVNRNPDVRDFYDEYDQFTVTDVDRSRYENFVAGLEPNELAQFQDIQNRNDYFYILEFSNLGGLVMPILLNITYADGTVEDMYIPAEIWRRNTQNVKRMIVSDKEIEQFIIDPTLETTDVDVRNNYYPRVITPSRIELYRWSSPRSLSGRDLMCEFYGSCDEQYIEENDE